MAGQLFEIVFAGQLAPGADPAQVRANLAKLFKTDAARVEGLFSGRLAVIKKGLDEATARHYQAALAKVGAVVEMVTAGAPAASGAQASVPTARAPQPPASNQGAAKPAANITPQPTANRPGPATLVTPKPPPDDITIAEPGVILVEAKPVPPANIDTSHLTLAPPGVVLVEPAIVPAPKLDLSGLQLAPVGGLLVEAQPVPTADIDTSALSLAER